MCDLRVFLEVGAPTAALTRDGCDRRCQGFRDLRIGRALTQLVAARWLAPLLGAGVDRQGSQQQLVDVKRGPVVRVDREDDAVLGRRPWSQQPVAAIQVAAATWSSREPARRSPPAGSRATAASIARGRPGLHARVGR
ncbi:MAG: hypothetical protein H0U28_11335 [Nocardioidaceae bacterium]|nr:hypothetical protein [Nocardioidaceae bacterium]